MDALEAQKAAYPRRKNLEIHRSESGGRATSACARARMALLRVGSLFALRVEALAAAAGGPVVRVAHEEAAPRDALRVVDARPVEVVLAVPVDEDLESVDLDDLISFVDRAIEREAVTESGTAAARDVHPEVGVVGGPQGLARLRVVPLDELLDLVRCRLGEGDLNHSNSPLLLRP